MLLSRLFALPAFGMSARNTLQGKQHVDCYLCVLAAEGLHDHLKANVKAWTRFHDPFQVRVAGYGVTYRFIVPCLRPLCNRTRMCWLSSRRSKRTKRRNIWMKTRCGIVCGYPGGIVTQLSLIGYIADSVRDDSVGLGETQQQRIHVLPSHHGHQGKVHSQRTRTHVHHFTRCSSPPRFLLRC